MTTKTLKRNIFQRILGIPATKAPADAGCWTYADGKLTIDTSRAPELSESWGAIRLEGSDLPVRVMVLRDGDGIYRAFRNQCGHAGRRLDPVPGTQQVQCCSMGKATYDYEGKVVSDSDVKPVEPYAVQTEGDTLIIELQPV
jgi:nitrite reductase/ring-hydroxylating ferredoxin subunit